ncbi:hypothetical protein Rifp1Sym_ck00060 [endosymbiont of Riftia pachyptila (vent Ph05)]|uniref:Uncharacterized protein n=1 Tax=endosymbiont of Riftia pachyptila (vent Ph05) TaxID=1048808 RepID=G2DF34_9GAMM|nr:hypothetical protein Rifp1Sym_ck00060 [endosymbiont of Riftia pachyptila (vent Ph05)]
MSACSVFDRIFMAGLVEMNLSFASKYGAKALGR